MRLGLLLAAMLVPIAALAQGIPAPAVQPCERDPAPHPTGGIDTDVVRCQGAFAAQQNSELSAELSKFQALYVITNKDLAKVKQEQAGRSHALDEWFKAWFGEPK